MLIIDFDKIDTIFCAHGRHGSNSLTAFAEYMDGHHIKFHPDGVLRSREQATILKEHHLDRKIVVMVREPREKFVSGLNNHTNYISGGDFESLPPRLQSNFIRASIKSCIRMNNWASGLGFETSPTYGYIVRDCARYTLGDPHLAFSCLSYMMVINTGLNVEVMDVTELNDFYATHGYTDDSSWNKNRVGIQPAKQKYYQRLKDHYLENIGLLEHGTAKGSPQEFNAILDMEEQAYRILTSENYVEESLNFCRDLTNKINQGGHLERVFLSMCMDTIKPTDYLHRMVKRTSEHTEGLEVNDLLYLQALNQ